MTFIRSGLTAAAAAASANLCPKSTHVGCNNSSFAPRKPFSPIRLMCALAVRPGMCGFSRTAAEAPKHKHDLTQLVYTNIRSVRFLAELTLGSLCGSRGFSAQQQQTLRHKTININICVVLPGRSRGLQHKLCAINILAKRTLCSRSHYRN